MKFNETKTSGLYVITGLLIGLTLWFSYDRIEKGIQNKKAEKYFTDLMNEGEYSSFRAESINISDDSFELIDQMGNPITIQPASGHIIFINIWASWSISCVENLPALSRLYNNTSGKIDFYLITGEQPEKVQRILKNQKLDLPCYYFRHMQDLPPYLQQTNLPYSCIIHEGKILFEYFGIAPWDSDNFIKFIEEIPKGEKRLTELIPLQKIDVLNIINFN
jgi:hypothetical protein